MAIGQTPLAAPFGDAIKAKNTHRQTNSQEEMPPKRKASLRNSSYAIVKRAHTRTRAGPAKCWRTAADRYRNVANGWPFSCFATGKWLESKNLN